MYATFKFHTEQRLALNSLFFSLHHLSVGMTNMHLESSLDRKDGAVEMAQQVNDKEEVTGLARCPSR